jgi:hypothetical protein
MRARAIAPVVILAVVLAACGSTETSSRSSTSQRATTPTPSNAAHPWREAKLRHLMGLRRSAVDATYRLAAHPECATGALLRSTAEIRTYKSAGDIVITNPAGSAGVKASGLSPSCKREFAQALRRVH